MSRKEKFSKWFYKAKVFAYSLVDIIYEEKTMIIEEAQEEVSLPEDYLARFSLESLENTDLLLGREEELKNLKTAYENWRITHNPVLVVGEAGEGTSSLLNASSKEYSNVRNVKNQSAIHSQKRLIFLLKNVFKMEEEVKTLNEIRDFILESDQNYQVVFENIERMFIRKIGGFSLIESFLLFLHQTKGKVYWVVSINKYSNYYLNSVKLFSSNFPSIIHLKGMEEEFLNQEIIRRNEGFNLVFLKPRKITKKFNKLLKTTEQEARQELLKTEFEKRMVSFAKGNISRAILYAKNSAFKAKENTIYIKPYEAKSVPELSLNELFLIEAIFQHSRLTINELNNVLRNSKRETRLAVEQLLEKNLIFTYSEKSGRIEYGMNLLYVNELKIILHERLNRHFKL